MPEEKYIREEMTVGEDSANIRLDRFLSLAFDDFSRSFLQRAIKDGQVTVGGRTVKPSYRTQVADAIRVELPVLLPDHLDPEPIPLNVLYEDEHMLAVNKPPDMVVHPSKGHARGTLANAQLHHCRENISNVNGPLRPGIVHRLDRDTSGIILCAKTNAAHSALAEQFKDRRIHKEYVAVVRRKMEHDSGEIALPIGRDPRMREKMCVRMQDGRPAVSHYFVEERFEYFTVVRVQPHTGRTHQIRVHLSARRHPVAADALYGGGDAVYPWEITGAKRQQDEQPIIVRQALHARKVTFAHPITGAEMSLSTDLPEDVTRLIAALRAAAAAASRR